MKQEGVKPSYVIVDNNSQEVVLQCIRKLLVEKLLHSSHVTRAVQKGADGK